MIVKDYYKILNLESSNVTPEEIKNAFREQAKKNHPDVNTGNKLAEEKFKDVNEAYKVLSDKKEKRRYDRIWNSKIAKKNKKNKQNEKILSNFKTMFFGNVKDIVSGNAIYKRIPIRGEDIETSIDVSISEAFYGNSKKIGLKDISGNIKTYDVEIPSGIISGEEIKLIGQGKKGQNGGKNGDLVIEVKIKDDENYKLKGNDIYKQIAISPWEAALGSKIEVNAIDETIMLHIPKGVGSGDQIKIDKKGYKDHNGTRGDFIIETKIVVPQKISKEEEKIYAKLSKISKFNPRKDK